MSAVARLLAVAERLAESCPPELGLEIAVTGSVGSGLADELSDLELLLLVEDVPEAARVAHWLESVGAAGVAAEREVSGTRAWCRVDGVEVEPYWAPLDEAQREVDALERAEAVEHGRLAIGHVFTHAVVLRSDGALTDFAARLASYPGPLPRRLVGAAADGWEIPSPRLGTAVRGDRFALQWFLQRDAERVLRIVFALNRRWELPRWKWLDAYASTLEVAPDRLTQRLLEPLLEPDGVAAVRAVTTLVRDTLALVPGDIDVTAARAGTDRRLAALEAA